MGIKISLQYEGELRCVACHEPSRTTLQTDAPVDNNGKGESFSPTDLVATALASCILTTLAIFAQRQEIDLTGAIATVEKEMIADPVRRIGSLRTIVSLPLPNVHPHRETLERVAHTCPVHRSLHPDVEKPILFQWQG